MKDDSGSPAISSRRQFAKAIGIAAIAMPLASSMMACKDGKGRADEPKSEATTSPTVEECFKTSGGGVEEHIPPMGIDGGGGSLLLDTKTKLVKNNSRYEEDNPNPKDKLGDIHEVRIITELLNDPFVSDKRYSRFGGDAQLWLWYQYLKTNSSDECAYDDIDYQHAPPDVKIAGGNKAAGRPFSISFPEDLKLREPTFKCGNPHRYRQADKPGNRGHLRVCQWRIVDKKGNKLFEDNVTIDPYPEHFRFYVKFDDYNPD